MTMCLSNIKPYDIFFANKPSDFKDRYKHYYVCVYFQGFDPRNKLRNDVYGLIITTNKKYETILHNDYNVPIRMNGKQAYVCCDKLVRIKIDENVTIKSKKLSLLERMRIQMKLDKFLGEILRQTDEKGVIL